METKHSIWRFGLGMFFVAALFASNASASLVVSGTSAIGDAGEVLMPTMSLRSDGSTDEMDLSQVESWVFRLDWGAAPLTFQEATSTISFGGVTRTLPELYAFLDPFSDGFVFSSAGSSFFEFQYLDFFTFQTVDLIGGFEFTGHFVGTLPGTYPITFSTAGFPSSLTDPLLAEFPYSNVSAGQSPMQVTVNATAPPAVSEPGLAALLAGGLLGMSLLGRRRGLSRGPRGGDAS